MADEGSTRRGVLAGTGMVGLAGFLAACGSKGGGGAATGGTPTDAGNNGAQSPAPGDSGGSTADGGATAGAGGGAKALARTAAIPVGGGKIFKGKKIVVTQPKKGHFKAFSAVCTHQ